MTKKTNSIDIKWLTLNGLFSPDAFAAQAKQYCKVACVGMFIAILAHFGPQAMHPGYLNSAMAQTLGPELWNIAGATGMIGLGLFALFPSSRLFPAIATVLLETSYSVGTLMTGALAGWMLLSAPHELATHGVLWTLFSGVVAIIALGMCALMNFFVWYLSWLVRGDAAFMNWLTGLKLRYRWAIGSFFVLMPTLSYLFQ